MTEVGLSLDFYVVSIIWYGYINQYMSLLLFIMQYYIRLAC